ncbi:thioredoxin [Chthonomonas calidirosea]|uniref:Thioredoxin n=1 Tax=Chthonomonas calidirosea (strain DSM 23976 / ICMP 18418 / T49) TaxID=1303518 RepID=S0ES53_CHTCT|nr:thioredoxin [Chthonomonas calidirosea]CCW33966.1 thioredoxin [Chthonomonas calidirosea T49]CEK15029.1 thioredoxin [Chthonomonas calidirosea]CEK15030.1 thioredoxin [Chthonomonas calidirosea]CEK16149.1 thioredoxin [Chthonomonas calidirosea]
MSHARPLTASDFEAEVINSNVPVVIDFWAEWCNPCRLIAPHVEALAQEYAGKAKVFKVNVDEEREIAEKYNILQIPTLLFFKNGKVVDQWIGTTTKETLARKLEALL